jgi:hypothetical protein
MLQRLDNGFPGASEFVRRDIMRPQIMGDLVDKCVKARDLCRVGLDIEISVAVARDFP